MSAHGALLDALRRGEVALLAVDTVVGLHASALSVSGLEEIRRLKGSDEDRPFLLLFDSPASAFRHGRPHPSHEAALRAAWPGALTALLTPTEAAPRAWSAASGLLAARVPALGELRSLIAALGAPLWSTSANLAGSAPAAGMDAARALFPHLVWADFAEGTGSAQPSTLVDLSGPEARILRQGATSWPLP